MSTAMASMEVFFSFQLRCFCSRRQPEPGSTLSKTSTRASALRSSLPAGVVGDEVMQMFVKERQMNGDFISKASDMLLWRERLQFSQPDTNVEENNQQHRKMDKVLDSENVGGFLKLTGTREWISGDNIAPVNRKLVARDSKNDSEKRKKLNLLRYDALKREMLLLTAGIGVGSSGYCLIQFSLEAAVSYAVGVLFSCLYLQLLYHHADNLSKETVPEIFMQEKSKKIGIRSEDLKNFMEKTLNGCTMALLSPRLVIPAAIYGLWAVSHNLCNNFFDFQLVPGMFGFFAYKAAALVQVYRDNEDLRMVFPDNNDGSINT